MITVDPTETTPVPAAVDPTEAPGYYHPLFAFLIRAGQLLCAVLIGEMATRGSTYHRYFDWILWR